VKNLTVIRYFILAERAVPPYFVGLALESLFIWLQGLTNNFGQLVCILELYVGVPYDLLNLEFSDDLCKKRCVIINICWYKLSAGSRSFPVCFRALKEHF